MSTSWTGPELPDGVKALISARMFSKACAVMMKRFNEDFQQVMQAIVMVKDQPQRIPEALSSVEVYEGVMHRIAEQDDDDLYRMEADDLYRAVGTSLSEALMLLTIAMWVTDGADLPEGLIEAVEEMELDEEE